MQIEKRTDCKDFEPKRFPMECGNCQTDGHYLCAGCRHIAPFETMEYHDNRMRYYPKEQEAWVKLEMSRSRILKLHYPQGHPYWQKDQYLVEMPDGKMIYPSQHIQDNYGGYRVYWNEKGVWVQICASGSGYGKVDRKEIPPKLLVRSDEYDAIEFVGEELNMSSSLLNDLSENGINP